LQVTGNSGAVIENSEQNGPHQLAARSEHLLGPIVGIKVDEAPDVTDLIASHFTIEEPRLSALCTGGAPGGDAALLGKAVGLEEAAQGGIGGQGLELGVALDQRPEVVVVQLHAPTLVRSILCKDGPPYPRAHRRLLAGIGAQLA